MSGIQRPFIRAASRPQQQEKKTQVNRHDETLISWDGTHFPSYSRSIKSLHRYGSLCCIPNYDVVVYLKGQNPFTLVPEELCLGYKCLCVIHIHLTNVQLMVY